MTQVVGLVSTLMLLLFIGSADAHRHDRPDLDDWFLQLKNAMHNPCCDYSEGERLDDVDWTSSEPSKCDKLILWRSTADYSDYCVRLDGHWWRVPKAALVLEPNRYGSAMVWPIRASPYGRPEHIVNIRCFLPGAAG